MTQKPKIIRACTVPLSLGFVTGMIPDLQKKYEVFLLSSSGDGWEDADSYPQVKRIKIDMERHIAPLKDLKALWKLYQCFRRERPTMVHSMTPKAGLLCMMAAWAARVPVRVHGFTGLVFPTAVGVKRKILLATDWLTCACATYVIPEGEGVKRDLQTYVTSKPMKVLGYGNCQGIDLDRFNPDKYQFKEKVNKVTFIAVGRLVGDKGINELVNAFSRLNREYPETDLLLVGDEERELDPLYSDTINLIDTNNAIKSVGWQTDVRPFYAQADVHILASYREGFPNVCIEAGAMGLPQIVTNINGANEIVIEGKNGTIIPSKDKDALYEAMKRMMDAEYRKNLATNARDMIANRFDFHYVRLCLYDFYDEIFPS